MKVLLVEDTDSLRRLFARILRLGGFEVWEAADGREALDCLEGFTPDLVLTDVMMPVLDGLELTRRVRAMPHLASVPVVAISAVASVEAERAARRAGAADFLAKPVDSETLLGRVASYA